MFYLFIVFVVISLLVIFFVFNRKRNIKQTPGNNENDSFTEQVKKDVEVVISTNNTAEDKPNGSEKLTDEADTPEAHAKKSGPSDEEPKRTADNTDKINAIDDIHDVSETDSETNVITNECTRPLLLGQKSQNG
jgi:cytoskeletal protein RodZ